MWVYQSLWLIHQSKHSLAIFTYSKHEGSSQPRPRKKQTALQKWKPPYQIPANIKTGKPLNSYMENTDPHSSVLERSFPINPDCSENRSAKPGHKQSPTDESRDLLTISIPKIQFQSVPLKSSLSETRQICIFSSSWIWVLTRMPKLAKFRIYDDFVSFEAVFSQKSSILTNTSKK